MIKTITPAGYEPIAMSELKLHLRLTDDTTEDPLLSTLIAAARQYCEQHTGLAFGTQTLELILDAFPTSAISLPTQPVQSVTSIKYKDYLGVETTVSTADYVVDTDSATIAPAYGKYWPTFTAYPINPVRIQYVAGYTTIPESLQQAMLLLIGHWYENREGTIISAVSKELEFAVSSLLALHQVRWWF